MTNTNSSVDPTVELAAVKALLDTLATASTLGGTVDTGLCYDGVEQGQVLPVDGFGIKLPYRDIQPGSTIPAARQRMLVAPEQSQPHIWAFQIEHVAKTRALAFQLAVASDRALIGFEPSTNAGPITKFYFYNYDAMEKDGDRVYWIATRFYETTLGQNPSFNG